MHATEIEAAVERKDVPQLERAFCALVNADEAIEGVESPWHAGKLLRHVLIVLYRDMNMMPEHVAGMIDHETAGALVGRTFQAGVIAIRTAPERWRQHHAEWFRDTEQETN